MRVTKRRRFTRPSKACGMPRFRLMESKKTCWHAICQPALPGKARCAPGTIYAFQTIPLGKTPRGHERCPKLISATYSRPRTPIRVQIFRLNPGLFLRQISRLVGAKRSKPRNFDASASVDGAGSTSFLRLLPFSAVFSAHSISSTALNDYAPSRRGLTNFFFPIHRRQRTALLLIGRVSRSRWVCLPSQVVPRAQGIVREIHFREPPIRCH